MKLTPKTMMMGLATYFAAASGGYLYLRSTKAPTPPVPCGCGGSHGGEGGESEGEGEGVEQGGQAFDRLADRYDSCINIDETVMGEWRIPLQGSQRCMCCVGCSMSSD